MKANDEAVRESDQLEQLRDRFELWRRDHPGRHRIPQELWSAAAELAQQSGLYRKAKRLRLGYDSLNRAGKVLEATPIIFFKKDENRQ